jgi:hypothetical protein
MYTVITHIIKEEHYDDLSLAIESIEAECNLALTDQYCSNVTISYDSDDYSLDNGWFENLVLQPPGGNVNINGGNTKVKMSSVW